MYLIVEHISRTIFQGGGLKSTMCVTLISNFVLDFGNPCITAVLKTASKKAVVKINNPLNILFVYINVFANIVKMPLEA